MAVAVRLYNYKYTLVVIPTRSLRSVHRGGRAGDVSFLAKASTPVFPEGAGGYQLDPGGGVGVTFDECAANGQGGGSAVCGQHQEPQVRGSHGVGYENHL